MSKLIIYNDDGWSSYMRYPAPMSPEAIIRVTVGPMIGSAVKIYQFCALGGHAVNYNSTFLPRVGEGLGKNECHKKLKVSGYLVLLLLLLFISSTGKRLFCQTIDEYLVSTSTQFAHNGADYLVISYDDFVGPLLPLLNLRNELGLEVKVIPLSFIYSFGDTSLHSRTEAIKTTISYIRNNWCPRPRFVLLVGDANEMGGSGDYCPAPRMPIFEDLGFVCQDSVFTCDNWYAELSDSSYLPVLAIGRLPVKTKVETEIIVRKIINYESNIINNSYHRNVTIISSADYSNSINPVFPYFKNTCLRVNAIRTDALSCSNANELITNAFNSGQLFIFAFVHADYSNRVWWGKCAQDEVGSIFSSDCIQNLMNSQREPLILSFG